MAEHMRRLSKWDIILPVFKNSNAPHPFDTPRAVPWAHANSEMSTIMIYYPIIHSYKAAGYLVFISRGCLSRLFRQRDSHLLELRPARLIDVDTYINHRHSDLKGQGFTKSGLHFRLQILLDLVSTKVENHGTLTWSSHCHRWLRLHWLPPRQRSSRFGAPERDPRYRYQHFSQHPCWGKIPQSHLCLCRAPCEARRYQNRSGRVCFIRGVRYRMHHRDSDFMQGETCADMGDSSSDHHHTYSEC